MKKVLILANSSGGLYDFRNELVLELLKTYKVYVSVPDDVAVEKLKAEGCQMIHTDINRRGMNPVQDLGLFKSYWKLLKEIKPDIVLYMVTTMVFSMPPRSKVVPKPVIFTIYGTFNRRQQKPP